MEPAQRAWPIEALSRDSRVGHPLARGEALSQIFLHYRPMRTKPQDNTICVETGCATEHRVLYYYVNLAGEKWSGIGQKGRKSSPQASLRDNNAAVEPRADSLSLDMTEDIGEVAEEDSND